MTCWCGGALIGILKWLDKVQYQRLYFTAPYQVEIRNADLLDPNHNELLVETLFSAISPGTELMIYRGQAPTDLAADASIASLSGSLTFPLQYGYAVVGRVIDTGSNLPQDWIGRTVFSFQPHQTHFCVPSDRVHVLPAGITPQASVFLANMETGVNFVMDGRPLVGERVAVFGQGVVGLLTTSILSCFPLKDLITFDIYPNRRLASLNAGASGSFDPGNLGYLDQVRGEYGIDLVFEISGSPAALDQAISVTGFGGRIVIGSWYGTKRVNLDLGGLFHRSRIQLISSQVSSISPNFTGRWNKQRRFDLAWDLIRQVVPERWITHTLPFQAAAQGYALLDQHPERAIQVLFDYSN